jgi:hypothetical protein
MRHMCFEGRCQVSIVLNILQYNTDTYSALMQADARQDAMVQPTVRGLSTPQCGGPGMQTPALERSQKPGEMTFHERASFLVPV